MSDENQFLFIGGPFHGQVKQVPQPAREIVFPVLDESHSTNRFHPTAKAPDLYSRPYRVVTYSLESLSVPPEEPIPVYRLKKEKERP